MSMHAVDPRCTLANDPLSCTELLASVSLTTGCSTTVYFPELEACKKCFFFSEALGDILSVAQQTTFSQYRDRYTAKYITCLECDNNYQLEYANIFTESVSVGCVASTGKLSSYYKMQS